MNAGQDVTISTDTADGGGSPIADSPAGAVIERMRRINPKADPASHLPDVHPARIPRHVAIIMDGNGRWAQRHGFPRVFGHRNGARVVREIVAQTGRLGIEALTLYSFSMENWKRPAEEVGALMELGVAYFEGERDRLIRENVRLRVIGRRDGLPGRFLEAVDGALEATAGNTGPILCLAINYGGRAEIVDAARALARRAKSGELDPDRISDSDVADHLYTSGIPDPDLLIRTAGERRISNFLLWQVSYAEIHVTDVLWPDFTVEDLHAAIRDFASRRRRFGGLDGVDRC